MKMRWLMITFYQKYWRTAFDIGLIVLTVYLIMLTFSYLYKIATPIFLAFVIFAIIEPFAKFLNKRGMKKSIATAISMLLFTLVILGALIGAGAVFASQIYQLTEKVPVYYDRLQEQIIENAVYLQDRFAVSSELTEKAKEYAPAIAKKASEITTSFLLILFGWATSISTFMVNFIVAIILAYFLSIEIDTWKRHAHEKTPNTFKTAFFFLKENVLKGIVSYLKAQLKLISLTFIIIFVALMILRVNNSFSIALLSAFFDILPLLGVSAVFIPWIIYLVIVGNTLLAIWLSAVLGVVILMRQILEPKITGDSLGVSAFTMLSFMIISLSLFGVAGLILSPILIILIKALYEQGYLKRWIRLPAEDYDKPQESVHEQ